MIKIVSNFEVDDKEKQAYIDSVKKDMKKHGYHGFKNLQEISLKLSDDNEVTVDYVTANSKFERIRRINLNVESLLCG